MVATAATSLLHLRAADEKIDRTPHIEDIFPSHALPAHDVAQKLEPLVVAVLQFAGRVLALLKAERVGAEHHITLARQRRARVVHGIEPESRRFRFSFFPIPGVLMPHRHRRRRIARAHAVGDQQQRRDRILGFRVVGEQLDPETILGHRLPGLNIERTWLRPRSA